MDFGNLLTKYKAVEVNKLAGLLNGHIVAQTPMDADADYLENGHILYLQKDGTLGYSGANAMLDQPFLHYTEELLTFAVGNEYFAVMTDEDDICYPRAIGLYEGDEFTTNNIIDLEDIATKGYAILDNNGKLKLNATFPTGVNYTGPVFKATDDTLPTGAAAARLTLLVKKAVVSA